MFFYIYIKEVLDIFIKMFKFDFILIKYFIYVLFYIN